MNTFIKKMLEKRVESILLNSALNQTGVFLAIGVFIGLCILEGFSILSGSVEKVSENLSQISYSIRSKH